jgi:protocatechuate 3,4-dioxygenase beta subunit
VATQQPTQAQINAEMAALAGAGAESRLHYPPYRSSRLRSPRQPLHLVDPDGA